MTQAFKMGYDYAEQKEIEPITGSSSSSNATETYAEAPLDPEKEAWAKSIGNALTKSFTEDEDHHARRREHTLGVLKMRAADDDQPTDWWFASTAIPLIAATFAPMANLLSIAALVVFWRNDVTNFTEPSLRESTSKGYPDPAWCYNLNVASLICGFMGNLFLLFNFTKRVRYIVALPATIVLFYIASGILIGITAAMAIHVPPGKNQVFSQGFWHAVIASVLYMFNSLILTANMTGYFLGHYPQHFNLTDEQRNLILQTMMFFIWLGAGAGVFATLEKWSYSDALYFCDVTVLTIGFGDFYATDDVGRGLVFPYSVGGTIILGLMVSSIHKFAGELSKDNVMRKHVESRRVNTLSRAVTISEDDKKRVELEKEFEHLNGDRPSISKPLPNPEIQLHLDEMTEKQDNDTLTTEKTLTNEKKVGFAADDDEEPAAHQFLNSSFRGGWTRNTLRLITTPVTAPIQTLKKLRSRTQKELVMREEKDRFDAMRKIQHDASTFKKWYALGLSVTAFGILWCIGALVFWKCEKVTQGMTYFQGLYFAYVSLLTIGYGDMSPKSNAGKPFFVVWSLIAVPTMTILISDMGDTVIASFKRGTFKLADFTVLPQEGIWHNLMQSHPWMYRWMMRRVQKKRLKKGMPVGPAPEEQGPSLGQLAREDLTEAQLTRKLAFAIRKTADDLCHHPGQRYDYEEWVEFTRLIRFTKMNIEELKYDEEQEGVVEWDWLDERSPMLSEQSESEWILDRLCESLLRLLKKNNLGSAPAADVSWRGQTFNEENVDPMDSTAARKVDEPTARQEARQRATGADAMLTFFTGDRRNAKIDDDPIWSARAKARNKDDRRKSSTQARKGPFGRVLHSGPSGTVGGGRGGAGVKTLKMRKFAGN